MRAGGGAPAAPPSRAITAGAPEEALYLGHDRARLARLRQVAVAPHLHRLLPVARQRVRRQRDDRDLVRGRVVLEHLRRLPAVDDRDGDVHQDQVGLLRARLRDPLLTVQGLRHPVAEVTQDGGINDAVILVVLDEQDSLTSLVHAGPRRLLRRDVRRLGWSGWVRRPSTSRRGAAERCPVPSDQAALPLRRPAPAAFGGQLSKFLTTIRECSVMSYAPNTLRSQHGRTSSGAGADASRSGAPRPAAWSRVRSAGTAVAQSRDWARVGMF